VAANSGSKLEPGTHQSGFGCRDGDTELRSDLLDRKALSITKQHDIAHDGGKVPHLSAYQLGHLTFYQIVFRIFCGGWQRSSVQARAKPVHIDELVAAVCSEHHPALVNHNPREPCGKLCSCSILVEMFERLPTRVLNLVTCPSAITKNELRKFGALIIVSAKGRRKNKFTDWVR